MNTSKYLNGFLFQMEKGCVIITCVNKKWLKCCLKGSLVQCWSVCDHFMHLFRVGSSNGPNMSQQKRQRRVDWHRFHHCRLSHACCLWWQQCENKSLQHICVQKPWLKCRNDLKHSSFIHKVLNDCVKTICIWLKQSTFIQKLLKSEVKIYVVIFKSHS